ncbi:MAG: glutathione synthase [Natronospirillum sp.]|uniref:glutathione synthase n=1 Tax=Natronospirillum sp. TaxID=2812955 RepID=UPI0025D94390|nr:glutathione synthase [Natronospirillum sp.]MCH8551706.1 glutathione synthase [Natronospirillum sp.]
MTVRLAVVMDPIQQLSYKKDSTLAMLWAARDRGWQLTYIEPQNLFVDQGEPWARQQPLQVFTDPEHYFELGPEVAAPLAEQDVILMRQDPPFDIDYVYATYLLEMAEARGVLVVNRPQALRDCNEKLYATRFPEFCPPHLVTTRAAHLRQFHQEHGDVIFKPLDGMGGASIFRLQPGDPNVSVVIETLTNHGQQLIMAQRYLPEITAGDKRILIVDGEPVPYCLARIPAAGETRGNLAAGGRGVAQPLSDRDREIANAIGPVVRDKGLLFVGLDVIGDYLTEINVTSPTCIREIDDQQGTDIGGQLMDAIERRRAQA